MKKKLAFVLGIRPDVIRASLVLAGLQKAPDCDLCFIWSGQHYSRNLKDIFFEELAVTAPTIELGAAGETDAEVSSRVIAGLYPVLAKLQPEAVVFLGDTNTVMGSVAAAQLNLPVVHIEGCMRSYDWRMPEEKYRTVVDHLSDIIYAYLHEYKEQGVREGLNPASIVVTGNPIVDVLEHYYLARQDRYRALATEGFFAQRNLRKDDYYLMTCHRRENVGERRPLERIIELAAAARRTVYFAASYRTQRALRQWEMKLPGNLVVVDPVGYDEFLILMTNARGVFTDSGTVVEEACVLQVPSVQMRRSTERPQVYDAGASVKFDPTRADAGAAREAIGKLESLRNRRWPNPFGDGRASKRITSDLLERLRSDGFRNHAPERYHLPVERAYRGDAAAVRA